MKVFVAFLTLMSGCLAEVPEPPVALAEAGKYTFSAVMGRYPTKQEAPTNKAFVMKCYDNNHVMQFYREMPAGKEKHTITFPPGNPEMMVTCYLTEKR